MNSGDPGGRGVRGMAPHCPGLAGRSRECLVLRLLYSYMARGTAVGKSAWSYARGRRLRSGQAGVQAGRG